MRPRLVAAVVALAASASSCRTGPPPAIAGEMADCIPPGAVLLAGARLDALRASPVYGHLPASAQVFLKPLDQANSVLAVFNGAEILLIEQGRFREAAPGATPAGSNLMLAGSPRLIQAALAQRKSGGAGSRDLLAQASTAAAGHALWIAARGGVNLPLAGDASNVNRLLREASFATVGLRIEAPMQLDFAAQCVTAEAAQRLEETLRAFLTLSAAGMARQKQLADVLRGAEVRRDGGTVRASLVTPEEAMGQVFELLAH